MSTRWGSTWNLEDMKAVAADYDQHNSYAEPQITICAFTPINRPIAAQLTPGPENGLDLAFLEGHTKSSKTPTRNKKRTASQLATPMAMTKKPRKASRSQKAQKLQNCTELSNQDISRSFSQTKYLIEAPQSTATGGKEVSRFKKTDAVLLPQAANVGAKVSARTMRKLDAFRFGAVSGYEEHAPNSDEHKDKNSNVVEILPHTNRPEPNQTHQPFPSEQDGIERSSGQIGGRGRVQYLVDEDEDMSNELSSCVSNHSTGLDFSRNPAHFIIQKRSIVAEQKEGRPLTGALQKSQDEDHFVTNIRQDDTLSHTSAKANSKAASTGYKSLMDVPKPLSAKGTSILLIEDRISESSQDEFPIDGDEVEDMLDLPIIHESFQPPSSLQFPFDDDSQTNEEYDALLQYSRPSSRRSVHTVSKDGQLFPVEGQTTLDALFSPSFRPLSSYTMTSSTKIERNANNPIVDLTQDSDENFLSKEDEQDLLALAAGVPENILNKSLAGSLGTSSPPKLQWNPPTLYKPTQSSGISDSIKSPSCVPTSQIVSKSDSPHAPHQIAFDIKGDAIPFVRPNFPQGVLDRSPVPGLSRSSVLRTCFRIGEALNVASNASRNNVDAIIELYSRVTYSGRDANGLKQYFQFADLFRSERPPFLNGSYDGWKGIELWEYSAKEFLGEAGKNKIARVLGRIKRDERNKTWMMTIMSIWAATWEDVGLMKGLVCA